VAEYDGFIIIQRKSATLILQCCVWCVSVKNTSPEPEPGVHNEPVEQTASQLWNGVVSGTVDPPLSHTTDFTLEMMNLTPFGLWLQLYCREQMTLTLLIIVDCPSFYIEIITDQCILSRHISRMIAFCQFCISRINWTELNQSITACLLWFAAVECKAVFTMDSFPSDVPVMIKVFLR